MGQSVAEALTRNTMANSLESFIINSGFEYTIGHNILKHLNIKEALSLRLVNRSFKNFVENPKFWLKIWNYKRSESMEIHESWHTLLQNIEEKNSDLKTNFVLSYLKLIKNYPTFSPLWFIKTFLPLNVVSFFGDLPLVKFIIENNMVENLNKNGNYGWTPICNAAMNGHTETVKFLVGYTDLNNRDPYGWTPIYHAALYGHTDTVMALNEFSNNINALDNHCRRPIHWAALNGHTDTVKAMINIAIDINIDINPIDNEGWTPIHCAARHGHTEIVRALIGFSDDLSNSPDIIGQTPFHLAAENGHTETVKLMIEHADFPNWPDNNGWTPLHKAAENGHTEIVKAPIGCTTGKINAPNVE